MAEGVPALHPERKGQLNISPKVNWVEKGGGLPAYINSVATALVRQGMTRQHAIQTAVNTVKKACATGLWGGEKRKVSPAIQAAACNAARQWEQLKMATSVRSDERMVVELAKRWEAEDSLELAWNRLRARALIELAIPRERGRLRRLLGRVVNLAGPSAMERKQAEKRGAAMEGGRFPIRNESDLRKAIRAVGRATDSSGQHSEAERAKVRRFIRKRAAALGLTSLLPDNWNADGSLA